MHDHGVYRACGTCVVQCTDGCTLWQAQNTPLLVASWYENARAVQALVDSKANLEARDEVAMWPVQPGAASEEGAMAEGYFTRGCTWEGSTGQEGRPGHSTGEKRAGAQGGSGGGPWVAQLWHIGGMIWGIMTGR